MLVSAFVLVALCECTLYHFTRGGGVCKAIPVTGRGGTQGFKTSTTPHFADNRLTVDGKTVTLKRRLPFNPQEDSRVPFLLEEE
jgi:hypothetical protein